MISSHSVQGAQDLWRRAFDGLEPSEAELLKSDGVYCAESNNVYLDKALREKKLKEWNFHVTGKTIKVRKLVQDILAVIELSGVWMKPIANADPCASLAWACISSLLTAVMDAKAHREAMLTGLQKISHLIGLYTTWDSLYTKEGDRNLLDAVVKLYTAILAYQARLLNYLDKNFAKRALRNLAKSDAWENDLAGIDEQHTRCQEFAQLADVAFGRQYHEYQNLLAQSQIDLVGQVLDELRLAREQQLQKMSDEMRMKILHSLSSDYKSHKNVNPLRVPGTCEWFVNDDKFLDWRQAQGPSLLHVTAGPGCGKSVLARHLVDSGVVRPSDDAVVAYFFFKDSQQGRNESASAVAALLHQIFTDTSRRSLIVHAQPSYEAHGDKLATRFDDLWDVLERVLQDPVAQGIVCVLDALDECVENDRERLLQSITQLVGRIGERGCDGARLNILITSRPLPGIAGLYSGIRDDPTPIVRLDGNEKIALIVHEIDLFIDHMVPHVLGPRSTIETREAVVVKLKGYENRTYLWLYLILDYLRRRLPGRRNLRDIEQLIHQIPQGVSKAYTKMLQGSSDLDQAKTILTFIVSQEKTISVDQLSAIDALARGGSEAYKETL